MAHSWKQGRHRSFCGPRHFPRPLSLSVMHQEAIPRVCSERRLAFNGDLPEASIPITRDALFGAPLFLSAGGRAYSKGFCVLRLILEPRDIHGAIEPQRTGLHEKRHRSSGRIRAKIRNMLAFSCLEFRIDTCFHPRRGKNICESKSYEVLSGSKNKVYLVRVLPSARLQNFEK